MRVAILSLYDYSGSGERIARAVKRHGWEAKMIRHRPHPFGFPSDIDITRPGGALDRAALKEAQDFLSRADVIHFKGDDPVPGRRWGDQARGASPAAQLWLPKGVPRVLTVGGSDFRRHLPGCSSSRAKFPMSRMIRNVDARVALTADLNYPEFQGVWIPAVTDCSRPRTWRPSDVPIIAHSPTHRGKKGTNDVVLPALELLDFEVELDLIEGVSYEESVRRKERATIFIDQCKVGFYGNSALEAMSVGIPTLCYLSDEAVRQGGEAMEGCPVRSFEPTPEGLAAAITRLMGEADRVSRETYDWTRKTHSAESVGGEYDRIYRSLL